LQSGLYKQPAFGEQRRGLVAALVAALLNPLWDAAREPLLDTLWGVAAADWAAFAHEVLPAVCSSAGGAVRERAAELCRACAEAPDRLQDFAHFEECVDAFVNDLRFFGKL
jgi:hypothetical protein